jgi:CheY-like chemotaxis protein
VSRILLVDNEPDAIEALRMCFELTDHHILTALDGWEAFEMASGKLPDLIITDWKMPRIDGLGLCQMLRHSHPLSGLPVILLSGEPPPAGRARFYDAYVRKPIPVETLMQLVSRLLSGRR